MAFIAGGIITKAALTAPRHATARRSATPARVPAQNHTRRVPIVRDGTRAGLGSRAGLTRAIVR